MLADLMFNLIFHACDLRLMLSSISQEIDFLNFTGLFTISDMREQNWDRKDAFSWSVPASLRAVDTGSTRVTLKVKIPLLCQAFAIDCCYSLKISYN
jgi:hypothetical protein